MKEFIMRKPLLAAGAVLAVGTSGVAAAATTGQHTHGVAYVGVTHTEGKNLYISGDFKDSLFGRGAIVYITRVGGSSKPGTVHVLSPQVTLYTRAGSLQGTGAADEVITSSSTTVKNGTFFLTKGTGAYKGHTFKGTFSGPLTQGVYTFTYSGVYR
jgi:hypothetical protein